MRVTAMEWAGVAALLVVCAVAMARGGALERRSAGVIGIAWIASIFLDNDASRGPQWALMALDVVLAVYLGLEVIITRRTWPLFASAIQFLIVLTHVAFVVEPAILKEGFFSLYYLWSYLVLLCLLVGALTRRSEGR